MNIFNVSENIHPKRDYNKCSYLRVQVAAVKKYINDFLEKYPRVNSYPFSGFSIQELN